MRLTNLITTGALSVGLALTLGLPASAFAQQEPHDQQQDQQKPPEPPKDQPDKAKPEEKKVPQDEKNMKPEERQAQRPDNKENKQEAAQQHRIPEDRFKAHFGREHTFHVSQRDFQSRRFAYGGYTFTVVNAWPANWLYTQDVYVVEIDGVYYLCNVNYPGVNVELVVVL